MKRIKAFFYNNPINYIIALVLLIICAVGDLFIEKNFKTLGLIICLYFFINVVVNIIRSRNLKYFRYGYPLFYKKIVWINQHVSIFRDKNKCPKDEFKREMISHLNGIPVGTTCYCCTHELIKKHILKKYPQAEVSKTYIKDLRKLKKKMETKKCRSCSNKDCTIFKNEKTQFYSIKFIK